MAFIGKGPAGKQVNKTVYKQWVAVESQTQFTFDRGIYDPNAIQVVVNNVVQEPNVDYNIASNGGAFNVINFTSGLIAGDVVYAVDKDEGALRLNNSAAQQNFTPGSGLTSTNVQTAIEEVSNSKFPRRFTVSGTGDAITGTLSPAIVSYTTGLRVTTTPSTNTVTDPTLNLNGLGVKTIKKRDVGGSKVALAAGDYNASGPFDFEYDGTDFVLLNPLPAVAPTPTTQHGQCRLTKSGSNLLLHPFNGNKLTIDGVEQTIPLSTVTLAPPATSGVTYYIYAYMSGGTMTLEYSATGHETDSATGVEIKSGDATRTLVGMARTYSSAWIDDPDRKFVISWFNRRRKSAMKSLASSTASASGSFAALDGVTFAQFLCWAETGVRYSVSGTCYLNSGSQMQTMCGRDGVGANPGIGVSFGTAAGDYWPAAAEYHVPSETEGFHYAGIFVAVSGSATWVGGGYTGVFAEFEG